jgi:serine/threonine-protein kinase
VSQHHPRVIQDKYVLTAKLALGGMGTVYLAHNRLTEGDVAVKVWSQLDHDGSSEATRERFREEARIGAALSHRNIVRVYDLLELGPDSLALVMELLRGVSLAALLRKVKCLPTKAAVAIIVCILDGLEHAHQAGVVHRDLKPANVFLAVDSDGVVTPKLLDFGIAKNVADDRNLTADDKAIGTPQYMSPEQIRHDPLDGRSDVFTVGALLYEMLVGRPAFGTGSAAGAVAAVLEREVDPEPEIEPRVWLEIKKAMSKRAFERHGSAAELADRLLAAIDTKRTAVNDLLRALALKPEPPQPIGSASARMERVTPGGTAKSESAAPAVEAAGGVNDTVPGEAISSAVAGVAGLPTPSSRAVVARVVAGVVVLVALVGAGWFIATNTGTSALRPEGRTNVAAARTAPVDVSAHSTASVPTTSSSPGASGASSGMPTASSGVPTATRPAPSGVRTAPPRPTTRPTGLAQKPF